MKLKLPGINTDRQKSGRGHGAKESFKTKYVFTVELPSDNSYDSESTADLLELSEKFSLNRSISYVSSLTTNSGSTWSSTSSESTCQSSLPDIWPRQHNYGFSKFLNGTFCMDRVESLNVAWYPCSPIENPKDKNAYTRRLSLAEKYQRMYHEEKYDFKNATMRNKGHRYQSTQAARRHRKTNRRRKFNESLPSGVEDGNIVTLRVKLSKEKKNDSNKVKKVVDRVRSGVERRKKVHRLTKI